MSAVRVLIADDQALVRAGFRMILDAEDDIDVVGEAADGLEALVDAGALVQITAGSMAGEFGSTVRRFTTTLGSGGPKIRAMTTNGSVTITRR